MDTPTEQQLRDAARYAQIKEGSRRYYHANKADIAVRRKERRQQKKLKTDEPKKVDL
jgi:hypothetical protein